MFMSNIIDVYSSYQIPKHLQIHMLRVTAFGALVSDRFDPNIVLDKESLVAAMLIHDMGNILKFDINVTRSLGVSEVEINNIEKTKSEYRQKYGNDEHSATYAIALELGVTSNAYHILTNMGSSKIKHMIGTDNWEVKIATYSDNRIDPRGVTTLTKRWQDVLERYKGRTDHRLGSSDEVEERKKYSFDLEKQIQSKCNLDLQSIDNSTIASYIERVKGVVI